MITEIGESKSIGPLETPELINLMLKLAAVTNSHTRSSVISDWRLILTSLVATPAFVHGHDGRENTGDNSTVAQLTLPTFLSAQK